MKSSSTVIEKNIVWIDLRNAEEIHLLPGNLLNKIIPNQKILNNTHEFHRNDNTQEKAEEFNIFYSNIGKMTYDFTQQTLDYNKQIALGRLDLRM